MFGNPNISATPIDDLYRTQADTRANSFIDPMNSANMNKGWGIDSSLLTPGSQAGYRPAYSGPQPYNNYGRVEVSQGINNLLNPFIPDPLWGNPFQHQTESIDAVSSRPADAAMWGVQRLAAPVAAFWAAGKLLGGYNSVNMTRGGVAAGRAFGSGLGRGLASSFGMGSTGSSLMARSLGGVGSAALGWGAPLLTSQALLWGAEKGVFNPYQNTRRTAQDLRDNFSGVNFGDSSGNSVHGGGLGYKESYGIAQDITSQGIKDMGFSANEYSSGASMIMRSGLTDSVNSKSISKRVKESMEQVKLIMSIASMPEMGQAIEQLSKLNMMGASVKGGLTSDASNTMRHIGGMAAVAGTTVQQMMNTVGAQGQYLYQANGMTPYLGQIAAANVNASFHSANRMGLISSSQLARLGGVEGATQSSLTGQINASQTLYNKMSNFNQYIGGTGRGGGTVGNMTRFGSAMAKDAVGTYGALGMYGNIMGGKQINERGSLALEDQLMDMAKTANLLDKNGKLSAERAYALLTDTMGLRPEEATAYLEQRRTEGNYDKVQFQNKALDTDNIKQQRQYTTQNKLYGGLFGDSMYLINKAGRSLTNAVKNAVVNPITNLVGSSGDSLNSAIDDIIFGSSTYKGNTGNLERDAGITQNKINPNDFAKNKIFNTSRKSIAGAGSLIGVNDRAKATKHEEVLTGLNRLYLAGDSRAQAYFNATNETDKRNILNSIINSGVLGKNISEFYNSDINNYVSLNEFIPKQTLVNADTTEEYTSVNSTNNNKNLFGALSDKAFSTKQKANDTVGDLEKVSGLTGQGALKSLHAMGLAGKLFLKMSSGKLSGGMDSSELGKDADLSSFMSMTGETDSVKALSRAQQMAISTRAGGQSKLAGYADSIADNKLYDPDLQKRYDEAISKGDKSLADKIKLMDLLKINNGVREGGNKSAGIHSNEENAGGIATDLQTVKSKARIDQLYKEGRIDFQTSQAMSTSLDNTETTESFKKSVKEFGEAVKDLKSNGIGSGSSSPWRDDSMQLKNLFSPNQKSAQTSGNSPPAR